MTKFEIKDEFYLDGKPFKIISGAIHYFRVVPEYWQDRLEKLKAMGCNTVETYVPWNAHEPQEGEFHFEDGLDVRRFIQTAEKLGLYVILRPSPYICAEWEFGGLPYWLLKEPKIKLRFEEPVFLNKTEAFFSALFKQVVDLQFTHGGPILLMQIENEYGGYANDLDYMRKLAQMMENHGVDVPLVTSDGPWSDMLENGSIPDIALPTINCGSEIKKHFKRLKSFHKEKKPLMVMEFWIGWFDAWGDEAHHTRSSEEVGQELADILAEGSVNFYMFHGGTNFGFNNGANYYGKLTADVTSYDYDAPLSEWGDLTPKYHKFKEVIAKHREIPDVTFSTAIKKLAYGTLPLQQKTSLFANLETIGKKRANNYPLSMEELDQGTGYVYYTSSIGAPRKIEDFRLLGCKDRAQVYLNQAHLFTQTDLELGEKKNFELTEQQNELGILVENMGRVNFSAEINQQKKGITEGVFFNSAFQSSWTMYGLPMDNLEKLDFALPWQEHTPGFYRFSFQAEEIGDTFVDFTGWGKGFAVINGHHLGRFWEIGPQKRLYVPGPWLNKGENDLLIFESEGKIQETITLTDQPSY